MMLQQGGHTVRKCTVTKMVTKKKKNHNIQTNIRKKVDFQINTPYSGATAAP